MTEKSSVNTKVVLIFLIGAVLGFVVGFALANGVNRQEQDRLRAEVAHAQSAGPSKSADVGEKPQTQARDDDDSFPTLTDDQLKNAVEKADANPDDAELQTKVGLTYFYDKPPDTQRAVREYRRALQSDPRQEMALQSLAAALIESGNLDEAERHLGELEQVNPSNRELPSLRAQL